MTIDNENLHLYVPLPYFSLTLQSLSQIRLRRRVRREENGIPFKNLRFLISLILSYELEKHGTGEELKDLSIILLSLKIRIYLSYLRVVDSSLSKKKM